MKHWGPGVLIFGFAGFFAGGLTMLGKAAQLPVAMIALVAAMGFLAVAIGGVYLWKAP